MSKIRRVSQIFFLSLFIFLLFQARFPYERRLATEIFVRFDPLSMWLSAITARVSTSWLLLSAITIVLTIFLGRVFCGWVCPMGTTIDILEKAIIPPRKENAQKKNLQWLKYAILLAVILCALFGINLWHFLDPIPLLSRIYTLLFYPLFASGADILLKGSRPVFEKLNLESLEYLEIKSPFYNQIFITLAIFTTIIGLSRISKRFFCRNLCPLGALFGIFSRFSFLGKHISSDCTNCKICEKLCPTGAIEEHSWKDRESECIKCFICEDRCPADAIHYRLGLKSDRDVRVDLSRRKFISSGFFGLGLGLLAKQSAEIKNRPASLLRPPGALPELEFLAKCTRCGECIKVCPTKVIQAQGLEQGFTSAFAPTLKMRLAGCDQKCRDCGKICPTNALRELDLEEKKYAKLGTAEIIQERCLVYAWGKMCLICDEICPYNAIIFKTINNKRVPVVIPSRCNGCGWCESACPVTGESAIKVSTAGEIRLREGSYKKEAETRGIDLNATDELEEQNESSETGFQ